MSAKPENEVSTQTVAETESYNIWKADEPDGEATYHLQLNNITVHFFQEEWDEFKALVKDLGR